ncbi:MAG: hypothetical protein AWU57_346 [Marinobacter sp. T13-3]|nr:MAG: hypothetical protein AWU57_346 [Marinobacter sp. T13-3]
MSDELREANIALSKMAYRIRQAAEKAGLIAGHEDLSHDQLLQMTDKLGDTVADLKDQLKQSRSQGPELWAYIPANPSHPPEVTTKRYTNPPMGATEVNITEDYHAGKLKAGPTELQSMAKALQTIKEQTTDVILQTTVGTSQRFIDGRLMDHVAREALADSAIELALDPNNPVESYRQKALEANRIEDIPQLWAYMPQDRQKLPVVTTHRLSETPENTLEYNITEDVLLGKHGPICAGPMDLVEHTLRQGRTKLQAKYGDNVHNTINDTGYSLLELEVAEAEARRATIHSRASTALTDLKPGARNHDMQTHYQLTKMIIGSDPMSDPMVAAAQSMDQEFLHTMEDDQLKQIEDMSNEQDWDELEDQIMRGPI